MVRFPRPVPIARIPGGPVNFTSNARGTRRKRRAFTLIEVVLAIAITIGMLGVVLYFYQQASHLRLEMLEQAESISAARLVMDRLTTELRCASAHGTEEKGLIGSSDSISFTSRTGPQFVSWSGDESGAVPPESDLVRIRYALAGGLQRWQEPLVAFLQPEPTGPLTITGEDLSDEPSEEELDSNGADPLLTEHIRYLRFRYWNGAAWQEQWTSWSLPKGIEVSVGREPLPEDLEEEEEYPFELFRRVIYLPGSEANYSDAGWLDFFDFEEGAGPDEEEWL
jgi:type II secretory pathway pseudopilin PulG